MIGVNVNMANNILCVKHGTKYPAKYVNVLFSMVSRHLSKPFNFYCVTEDPKELNEHIKIITPPRHLAGWWCKPYVFAQENGVQGPSLFLDLDVVIIQSIDKIFDHRPNQLNIIRDFNRKHIQSWDRYNSSVFTWNAPDMNSFWEQFNRDYQNKKMRYPGDQDWMYAEIKGASFFPDTWIQSYKWEVKEQKRMTITAGKKHFDDIPSKLPEDCAILVFHGKPNPHELEDKIIVDNWK